MLVLLYLYSDFVVKNILKNYNYQFCRQRILMGFSFNLKKMKKFIKNKSKMDCYLRIIFMKDKKYGGNDDEGNKIRNNY